MKKLAYFAGIMIVAILMAMPVAAQTVVINSGAEAQSFANLTADYSQGVTLEKLNECGITTLTKDTIEFEDYGYGSLHTVGGTLVFGGAGGVSTATHTVTNSQYQIDATIQQMNGAVTLGANAGSSADAALSMSTSRVCDPAGYSMGYASQTFAQSQTVPYVGGGSGTQSYTGTTTVTTSAGASIP